MLIVSWFICGMLYFILGIYLFSKILNLKTENKKSVLFFSLVLGILNIIILVNNIGYLKPYLIILFLLVSLYIIYKQKFVKTLIGVFEIIGISTLSELFFGIILLVLIDCDPEFFDVNPIGYYLINILISIGCIFIIKIKIVIKLLKGIIEWYNENEIKSLLILIILGLVVMTFILYNNILKILPQSLLLVTNLFCIAVFVFVIGFFKEKTNNNKIIYEYDQLMDYVKTYENLLDEKSKRQHEYRNQLAVIRIMAKNKRTQKYIDELLEEENIENNLETSNKLKYIPKGGLKGLIYYKLEAMKKKKINFFVDVSSELDNHKLWKECDKNLQDISKVLGVYLDNAIEASESSKDKFITFEVYLDDNSIVFKISNTYENKIDVNKIDKEGYSTKGKGKGYGLSLVKDIISKNKGLTQKREINGIYYIQSLYIKK